MRSSRFLVPVFLTRLCTWDLMVSTASTSSSAISWLVFFMTTRLRTSASRSDGPCSIQLGGHKSLGDTARVMGSLLDIMMARVDRHKDVVGLAEGSAVAVINGMSEFNHPTQEMGDLMTMLENLPEGKKIEE